MTDPIEAAELTYIHAVTKVVDDNAGKITKEQRQACLGEAIAAYHAAQPSDNETPNENSTDDPQIDTSRTGYKARAKAAEDERDTLQAWVVDLTVLADKLIDALLWIDIFDPEATAAAETRFDFKIKALTTPAALEKDK